MPVSSDWPAWNLVWRGQCNHEARVQKCLISHKCPSGHVSLQDPSPRHSSVPAQGFFFPMQTQFSGGVLKSGQGDSKRWSVQVVWHLLPGRLREAADPDQGLADQAELLLCGGEVLVRGQTHHGSPEGFLLCVTKKALCFELKCVQVFKKSSVSNSNWLRVEYRLTPSCAAVGVDVSLPDHGHAHVSHHQEGQRPAVPAGAVHRLQSDGRFPSRQVRRCTVSFCFQAAGLDLDLCGCDETWECVKRKALF